VLGSLKNNKRRISIFQQIKNWMLLFTWVGAVSVCFAGEPNHPSIDKSTLALWQFDSPRGGRVVNKVPGSSSLTDLEPRTIYQSVKSPTGSAYHFQEGLYGIGSEELASWVAPNETQTRNVPFTIEYWFRPTAVPAGRGLLFNQAFARQAGWSIFLEIDLRARVTIENPDRNRTESFSATTPLKLGQWVYLAVVYDGSHIRIFLDGKLDAEHSYAGPCLERKGGVLIGAGSWTDCFVGDIDAVRLSRGARTTFDRKMPEITSAASPVTEKWYDSYRPAKTYMDLAGWWSYRGLPGMRSFLWPMPEDGWKPVFLPSDSPHASLKPTFGYRPEVPTDYHWFQRDFTLSKELRERLSAGERLILHLGGLGYRWQLRVNGTKVAEVWDAFNSYDYDVTNLINRDRANQIALGTSNRNGFAAPDAAEEQIKKVEGDFLIAPVGRVGGHSTRPEIGVWGEIELWARPVRRIEDVFVRSSFRGKRLDVDVEITGGGSNKIKIAVLDADKKQVLNFAGLSSTVKSTLSAPWPNPRLWMPHDPYLYTLEVTLFDQKNGKVLDTRQLPFGFREIWIEGENLIFNGKRLFLARTSAVAYSERDAESLIRQAKQENANTVRLHVGDFFRPGAFAHYADRVGMLVIPESPLFWQPWYRLKDSRFWTNYQNQLKPWVRGGRNHPSIALWSLSNEVLWCDAQMENPNAPKLMFQAEQQVRAIDPTRPVQFDGDWDLPPLGKSKIANLHYPWEPVDHWYPTECWAFQNPNPRKPLSIRGNVGTYRWKRGEKPIVVGEFSCAFKTFTEAPAPMTKYVGDRAYDWNFWSDFSLWRQLIRWQCDAWRVARFAGINPWYYPNIPDHENWSQFMPLETVVLKDQYRTFFSGEKIDLKAFILNDTLQDGRYQVRWTLRNGKETLFERSIQAEVEGGGIYPFDLGLELPNVSGPENMKLTIQVLRDSKAVNSETYHVRVRPMEVVRWPARTILFDPRGQTTALFSRLKVSYKRQTDLRDLSQVDSVILGRQALSAMNDRQIEQLRTFVQTGGNVLAMGEESWSVQASRIGLNTRILPQSRANRAWVRASDHPAIRGITDADLALWRDGDWVTEGVLEKPSEPVGVAWRTVIDVGSTEGLNGAAVMEVFDGKGRYLLNQLNLNKAVQDPGARAVLADLLKGLARKTDDRTGVSLLTDKQSVIAQMISEQAILQKPWDPKDIRMPLFIEAGFTQADPASIAQWVRSGGRAWLLDMKPELLARWSNAITGGLTLEPCDPQEGCLVRSRDPLMWGISSEEMFWATGVWTMTCVRTSQSVQDPYGVWRLAKIASYEIHAGKNAISLVSPSALVKIPDGKGYWLVSTIDFGAGKKAGGEKTYRLSQNLFTNFGLSPCRDDVVEYGNFQSISLVKYVNRGFQDDRADNGKGGWTDQGESDLRFFPVNLSGLDRFKLPSPPPKDFPHQMILGNVAFEILDPREHNGKSCLMLEPGYKELPLVTPGDYIPEVKGIPIDRKFDRLYSLHSAGWASSPSRTTLWWYIFHYSDGTTAKISVRQDVDVADWTSPRRLPNARVGWAGDSMTRSPVGLFVAGFDNPFPQQKVKTLEIVSARSQGIPGIVALTTAEKIQIKKKN
jgi:hypothetical protein